MHLPGLRPCQDTVLFKQLLPFKIVLEHANLAEVPRGSSGPWLQISVPVYNALARPGTCIDWQRDK